MTWSHTHHKSLKHCGLLLLHLPHRSRQFLSSPTFAAFWGACAVQGRHKILIWMTKENLCPKRLCDYLKWAVFTQHFEQHLPDTSLLIKHLEQAQQLSVSRGGHRRGWEGEDHQLVRICLKKQRRAESKKEGNETVVRGCFLRLSKEISEGIRRSVSRLAERKNGTRQSARPIKWASVAWTPILSSNSHNHYMLSKVHHHQSDHNKLSLN